MLSSVEIFLRGLIDYAGLFPPASLSLEDAFSRYFEHQNHSQSLLLARFVCPAKHVFKLPGLFENLPKQPHVGQPPLHVSLLVEAADESEEQVGQLSRVLSLWADLIASGNVHLDCVEAPLPKGLLGQAFSKKKEHVERLEHSLFQGLPAKVQVPLFLEMPWSEDPSLHAELLSVRRDHRFAKLRTGGVVPAQVPSLDKLASAIETFARASVSMKFTAGLHEPLRHNDLAVGTKLYGFLNVFFAAFGAILKGWTLPQILKCLEADSESFWEWHQEGVKCGIGNTQFSNSEIREGRSRAALSFGSCSFLEPVEGLHKLGLLPGPGEMLK